MSSIGIIGVSSVFNLRSAREVMETNAINEGDKIDEDAFKKLIREAIALNLKSKKQPA